jgi:hypothetical protein
MDVDGGGLNKQRAGEHVVEVVQDSGMPEIDEKGNRPGTNR